MDRKKLRNIFIGIGLVLVLAIVWGLVLLVPVLQDKGTAPSPTSSESAAQVQRSVSGKTIDEDRQAATTQAQALLNEALKLPEGEKLEDFLQKLNDGDLSQVPPAVTDKLRFVDQFADSNDARAGAYQTIYALAFLMQSALGTETIEPVTDTAWKNTLVDQEAGVAYVPMSLFTGQSSGFSLELIYSDGEWTVSPYSLVEAVKLSAALSNKAEPAE